VAEFVYDYPHPALATDIAIFNSGDGGLKLLLIQRKSPPFQGDWALPGGFLEPDEDLDSCAARELTEETGISGLTLHAFANFSTPGRDPRGWTVSAAYLAVASGPIDAKAGDDAASLAWFEIDDLPPLAFDHASIISRARAWLTDHAAMLGVRDLHNLAACSSQPSGV
jgi:8-oxo-dGTP diphosphatase